MTEYAVDPLFELPAPVRLDPQRVRVAGDLFHGRVPDGAVYVGRAARGLTVSPYANRHRAATATLVRAGSSGRCAACTINRLTSVAVDFGQKATRRPTRPPTPHTSAVRQ